MTAILIPTNVAEALERQRSGITTYERKHESNHVAFARLRRAQAKRVRKNLGRLLIARSR